MKTISSYAELCETMLKFDSQYGTGFWGIHCKSFISTFERLGMKRQLNLEKMHWSAWMEPSFTSFIKDGLFRKKYLNYSAIFLKVRDLTFKKYKLILGVLSRFFLYILLFLLWLSRQRHLTVLMLKLLSLNRPRLRFELTCACSLYRLHISPLTLLC